MSSSRWLARVVGALVIACGLAGCGFHLRGDVTYPFSTLYLNTQAGSPIGTELKRTLQAGGTKVTDTASAAEVILDVAPVVDDKQVLSLSGGGRVREYALAKRVIFSLHDSTGHDWMPSAEIIVRRSYTFNESEVLARQSEETRLLREMQTDVVQQIMRRLQSARKPA
jgi:LPS-assembly lipoprotein